MPTRRQSRVAEHIHREIGTLLMLEARDPRLAAVTVTGVTVTPDLLLAHIYYSVLGDEAEVAGAGAALEHAKGYLRTELAARLGLRFMPELAFHIDTSAQYGLRIDALLDRLKAERGPDADEPGPA